MTEYTECRTTAEIGNRALFVGYILSAFRLRGQEEHPYADLIDGFRGSLQRSDRELLTRGDWPEELQRDLLWQTECLHVLLWSLGKVSALLPMDTMESREPIVAEINRMGQGGAAAWLQTVARRSEAELSAEFDRVEFWLWRVRSAAPRNQRVLMPQVKDAVASALRRGVLRSEEVAQGDVIANGQPFFALDPNAQAMTGEIVTERARALYWIWKDFDDWWNPVLDT